MAVIIGNNQVKKNDGTIITPKQGEWYDGEQYWNGSLSKAGYINSQSDQVGAGQAVSTTVNAASAAAQGKSPAELEAYLQTQRDIQAKNNVTPTVAPANNNPTNLSGADGGGSLGLGTTTQTTLNLPDLYKSLSASSGVSDLEKSISDKTAAFNSAQSKINDNPWLSEGNRTGRVEKLQTDYNNAIKNDQDSLTMKKQDIQTQLDLATKQFDINSQTAKQALDQFNTLLSSGALAGASGSDIAAITASTGISSTEIQAAINAQKKKDVQTTVTTVDDGSNVYSVVINSQTGEIISKQVMAKSKPASATTTSVEESKITQSASANQAIMSYVSDKNAQTSLSPEEYVALLMKKYPYAGLTIDYAQKIRDITGQ